jgi:plasmid stability protein
MAVVLQLKPDLEETLRTQAAARGLSLEEYVQSLLEQGLAPQTQHRRLTLREFEAALDAIGAHADKIPELPPEALTREGIYRDHD